MDLLDGQRFTVASYSPAAAYAGWLLRQFGARVDHTTALDREGLGAFLGEGAELAEDPLRTSAAGGAIITDAPTTAANRETLRALSGRTQVTWITPWGIENPSVERPATALTLYAAGGWMPLVGDPGREPLSPPGNQVHFIAGLFAAVAALSRFTRPERGSPAPALTGISMLESAVATMIYDTVAFQYFGQLRGRVENRYSHNQPTIVTLPCKDGHIGIHAALHGQWVALCHLIGHPELVHDPRFASPSERGRNIAELDTYLLPWLAERARFDLYHELQAHRIPSSPLPDMAEVLGSPQLAARDFWRTVTTPSGRALRVPGPPAAVLASSGPSGAAPASGPWREGRLRVVDLSMGWAGPMVSYILSSFGADVIKVEGPNRFDWWRGSRPPGDDPALALHERSHVFNSVNRGKRGITLDLATERGRDLARRLISGADVVVENFRAGVIEKLGLSFEALAAENPRLIMLRQPGFGSTGPESGYFAFGNTIEGQSGLTSLTGYEDGPPMMLSNALGDPVSGLTGTIAVLAALAARERDGRGRLIECPQVEGFLPLVSEALIEYQSTGVMPSRHGNARPGHVPSGALLCADGEWAVLEVETDQQWASLAAAIGEPWALDPELAGVAARVARSGELLACLETWAAKHSRDEFLAACQGASVPTAPVHTEADLLTFDALSDFWYGEDRAVVGFHLYPSLPIVTAGERPTPPCPAPTLGQHTGEALAAMGVDGQEAATLAAVGVIAPVPEAK